ncbi:MAG: bifunctional 4-hydroxy-2-oxoglutarate aldolase/2-dehydro-3-deoxy-phosphogluconate aldolase [Clostridia bacterium]|nr:bifunctional 4-hydroxy-2-oxoglutarate aldolase/2-dehydro-3-deoxy-phosphogluconate aldolase [Clostridia bacterium]
MTKEQIVEKIKQLKVIAIARGVSPKDSVALAKALYDGGVRIMELTLDQKNPESWAETANAISAVQDAFGETEMIVGAGTVVMPVQVDLVYKAGAKLIISPDANEQIIRRTVELGMVSIPGAMTPTEILAARRWGADFVKVFPAGALGASYIKAIRAPINHVPLLAVGGVNEKNLGEFLAAGAVGAGIGGNLVKKEWISSGEFHRITETALKITNVIANLKEGV